MKVIPFYDLVRRYYSGEEFVLFDTETTGLNTYHDEIIEVAGVIWKKDGFIERFEELIQVNPNKMMGEAAAVHKITVEDLKDARSSEEVLGDFMKFCDGRVMLAHNIKFDFPMLNSNLVRSGLKPYQNDDVACSLVYAKEQQMPGKLSELARHLKIETASNNLHRAMYDVEVLMNVMNRIMKDNEPEEMQYSLIL